jgi:PAS domain S-box-containing protein
MGIRAKILSIALIILILSIAAEIGTSSYFFTREYRAALRGRAFALGETLKAQLDRISSLGIHIDELVGFDKQCQELVERNSGTEYAVVLDSKGNVLFQSDPRSQGNEKWATSVKKIMEGNEAALSFGENDYQAVVPIVDGTERVGTILVGVSAEAINEKIGHLLNYSAAVTLITLACAAVLLFLTLRFWVAKPLGELFDAIRHLQKNDKGLYDRIDVSSKDEIGHVSAAFNGLIEDLNTSHETILAHAEALETMVDTRTAQLRELNKQLERDIAEREEMEKALAHSQALMRYIIEHNRSGIAVHDRDMRYIYVSEPYLRDFKIEGQDVIGLHHYEVFPDLPHKWRDVHRRALAGEILSAENDNYVREDGTVEWTRWECRPWYESDGSIGGIIVYTELITERKRSEDERRRLEERLQRAEKMEALGTLAGGVAHDLNNVLGIVVGYSHLLLDSINGDGEVRSDALNILKGGERAAAIVQDLLTLARRGVPTRKILNLNDIVLECQSFPEFKKMVSFHPDIRIETDLNPDLLNISGSAVHLSKSLINLISNAVEAMPQGGLLTLRTDNQYLDRPISGYDDVREGDYVVLSVADQGEGISENDLQRIFEPFYTKKVMGRSGTGLGLAVVWGTVKDHQGYINVESEKGRGTTFTLHFPVTREDKTPDPAAILPCEYMGKGETILIVDDVREQRELAAKMLGKLDYRTATVSSGEEAVAYLKEHTVDLAVLDMIMDPGMDGLETYRAMLQIHPRQKAIIVSGFSETERVSEAIALGAGAYVKKPYVLSTLGLAIRKELSRTG